VGNGWSNFQEWKNVAKFSKEVFDSKMALLPIMMIMIIMIIIMMMMMMMMMLMLMMTTTTMMMIYGSGHNFFVKATG
jgi:hypothetical protein